MSRNTWQSCDGDQRNFARILKVSCFWVLSSSGNINSDLRITGIVFIFQFQPKPAISHSRPCQESRQWRFSSPQSQIQINILGRHRNQSAITVKDDVLSQKWIWFEICRIDQIRSDLPWLKKNNIYQACFFNLLMEIIMMVTMTNYARQPRTDPVKQRRLSLTTR